MRRRMFLSKIHRATVTHADLDYEGSVTISQDLLEAAGMLEHEEVHVWNVSRGTRLVTYTLAGPPHSGVICINGAAAHLVSPGDLVILSTFGEMDDEAARSWSPTVVMVDGDNHIVEVREEVPGPQMPPRLAESA